jgi:hypothetical protein
VTEPAEEKREAEAPPSSGAPQNLEVGATVRAAFALWRAALVPLMWLAAIGLIASVPFSALMAFTGFNPLAPETYTPLALLGAALALILGLPFSIGSAAGSLVVLRELAQAGEIRTGTLAAFLAGYRSFWRVLGAWLAMGAVVALAATPAGIAWFGMDEGAPQRVTIAFSLAAAAALASAILWVRCAPVTAVAVLEEQRPIAAIFRAAALTRGRFWRVLGVLAVFAAVSIVAQMIAALLGGSPETTQILTMAIEVGFLGPLSAALSFALYLGLARTERPKA